MSSKTTCRTGDDECRAGEDDGEPAGSPAGAESTAGLPGVIWAEAVLAAVDGPMPGVTAAPAVTGMAPSKTIAHMRPHRRDSRASNASLMFMIGPLRFDPAVEIPHPPGRRRAPSRRPLTRSEERRVGKERSWRGARCR